MIQRHCPYRFDLFVASLEYPELELESALKGIRRISAHVNKERENEHEDSDEYWGWDHAPKRQQHGYQQSRQRMTTISRIGYG